MNEDILKEMPEYVTKLPKKVQNFVFEGKWQGRTEEVAVKYSLSDEQTDKLVDNVLFILIGLETPDNFTKNIIEELNISKVLAEQILEELDKRVFQYALNQISESNKEEEVLNVPMASEATPKQTEPSGIRRIDENGLENLRTMESDIKSFKNPQKDASKPQAEPTHIEYKAPIKEEIKPTENNDLLPSKDNEYLPAKDNEFIPVLQGDNFVPHNLPGVEVEPVQKPISVPRYTADPELIKNEINPEPVLEKKENLGSIVGSKLNETTVSKKETPKVENPSKYSVDPYREPIE